jgi:hypothetical protein
MQMAFEGIEKWEQNHKELADPSWQSKLTSKGITLSGVRIFLHPIMVKYFFVIKPSRLQ